MCFKVNFLNSVRTIVFLRNEMSSQGQPNTAVVHRSEVIVLERIFVHAEIL